VAWVDCDVIFLDPDWPRQALEKLRSNAMILQLFNRVFHVDNHFVDSAALQNGEFEEEALAQQSVLVESSIVPFLKVTNFCVEKLNGRDSETCVVSEPQTTPPASGMAWAAPRELFEHVGLYDAAIIGGGDSFFLAACTGTVRALSERSGHSAKHRYHAEVWANQFAELIKNFGISYLECQLIHLWHGAFSKRQYRERQQLLKNYCPTRDLQVADSGAWQWQNPQGALAQSVAQYFFQRSEDG